MAQDTCGDGIEVTVHEGEPKTCYVLALDVGSTSIRAHIYNKHARILSEASRQIVLSYPQPGFVEMDEELLWTQTQEVVKESMSAINLEASDITCMGIACQRNTFITWDRETDETFHHFIGWQDLRATDMVKQWNNSYTMTAFNKGAKVLHAVSRRKKFLAGSVLRFQTPQVSIRLLWLLENNEKLKRRLEEKMVRYGSIDTWLLWKLTKGKVFATDYSSASASGFYDPFSMEWSPLITFLLNLPLHMLPEVRDTSGDFGQTDPSVFGAAIPITAVVADQQSAMFGQCCFDVGDVKCTMGTGTFIDCNTGDKPHASVAGLYPIIGWKIKDELVFLAEGYASDTGHCIEWAKSIDLFSDISKLSDTAKSVPDSGGVQFVPSFTGLQAPINDDKACTSLMGITMGTTKAHIVRAILESLAYRFKLLYETVLSETKTPLSKVCKCDGGVCNNEFLVQLVSDLINRKIDKPEHMDMTSLGAAFLSGLAVGVWKDKEELKTIRKTDKLYEPCKETLPKYQETLKDWDKAVKRSKAWYQFGKT